jgi:POT family proton-dependent oligopeptide transporter
MAERKFMTAPIATDKMPPAVPFIIGNEIAERFSYYGLGSILIIFMTKYLMDGDTLAVMSENEATSWYHQWKAWAYFFPLVGSLLADVLIGRYRTILYLSIVYCIGHGVLALNQERMGLFIGLALVCIGVGGIKPCVSSNVGDQFGKTNAHLMTKVFSWFYFSINIGSAVSTVMIPWLLEGTAFTLPGRAEPFLTIPPSPELAFGVPGILMGIATIIFWMGRYKYVHVPPGGMASVREALSGEGLPAIGRLSVLFLIFIAPFWSVFDQMSSTWVLQAERMNLAITENVSLKSSQTHSLNPILILLFIPLFSYVIYPAVNRVWTLTPLRKIGVGLFLAALSFAVPALIEYRIEAAARLGEAPPSVFWQAPAYMLLTAGEVLVSVTGLEFAYTQSPRRTKSFVMSIWYLSVFVGNQFASMVNALIMKEDGSSRLEGANYFWFFVGFTLLTTTGFVFYALTYRGRTYLQDESPTETPDSA